MHSGALNSRKLHLAGRDHHFQEGEMHKSFPAALTLKICSLLVPLAILFCHAGWAQVVPQDRAAAVPLVTHSPYFSIWSASD